MRIFILHFLFFIFFFTTNIHIIWEFLYARFLEELNNLDHTETVELSRLFSIVTNIPYALLRPKW